jgi:UPF0755 protein
MINKILGEVFNYMLKIVIIIGAVFAIYQAAMWAYGSGYELMAQEPDANRTIITKEINIPQGASTETIANILEENELIRSAVYFRILAKLQGVDSLFQYGDFSLNTGMEPEEIITILSEEGEKREVVKFTIPEGFSLEQIAERVAAQGLCTESEFMDAAENGNFGYRFIDELPDRPKRLQGYLFPATYEVYADASAEDIISKMLMKFDDVFIDEYYVQAEELGYSVDEIITIASMIEKEVRVPEERPKVAGVIYNRLNIDMSLQMCSTVMYALGVPRDRLLYSDLEIISPYNTYNNLGLPIGPIANPGAAAIEASLYPENHNYLYFVLKDTETGAHEFNATLDDHNAAKNKYNQKF